MYNHFELLWHNKMYKSFTLPFSSLLTPLENNQQKQNVQHCL